MTADDFRKLALSLPGSSESSHMHHPDFRVGRRVFATRAYPDRHPTVFVPVPGGWGRGGFTVNRRVRRS